MTKYKFKIDTPWGKKGEEANCYVAGFRNCYEKYPVIFEPIIEKTNQKKWQVVFKRHLVLCDSQEIFLISNFLDKLGYNADAAYNEICGDKK